MADITGSADRRELIRPSPPSLALRPAQSDSCAGAVTIGVMVVRGVIDQRRVRHVDDRKGHTPCALENPGLGHRALAASARRAGTRPTRTPRTAHRGIGD